MKKCFLLVVLTTLSVGFSNIFAQSNFNKTWDSFNGDPGYHSFTYDFDENGNFVYNLTVDVYSGPTQRENGGDIGIYLYCGDPNGFADFSVGESYNDGFFNFQTSTVTISGSHLLETGTNHVDNVSVSAGYILPAPQPYDFMIFGNYEASGSIY